MQALLQRFQRLGGGVRAGHRNLREGRVGEPLEPHRDRARRDLDGARARGRVAADEQRPRSRRAPVRAPARSPSTRIIRSAGAAPASSGDEQARLAENVLVRRRPHQERHTSESVAAGDLSARCASGPPNLYRNSSSWSLRSARGLAAGQRESAESNDPRPEVSTPGGLPIDLAAPMYAPIANREMRHASDCD